MWPCVSSTSVSLWPFHVFGFFTCTFGFVCLLLDLVLTTWFALFNKSLNWTRSVVPALWFKTQIPRVPGTNSEKCSWTLIYNVDKKCETRDNTVGKTFVHRHSKMYSSSNSALLSLYICLICQLFSFWIWGRICCWSSCVWPLDDPNNNPWRNLICTVYYIYVHTI